MQPDRIVKIGNSLLQHGPANDRVYLMKLDEQDLPDIVDEMDDMALEHGYSKLFAKVPAGAASWFTSKDFVNEARVPRMYRGESAGCFMSKFLSGERAAKLNQDTIEDVHRVANEKSIVLPPTIDTTDVVRLGPEHAKAMAGVYARVFESYPFPIEDPEYIREAMKENVLFYGIFLDEELVAVASAEVDDSWKCAEMTDFATLPQCRGKGAAGKLLSRMESAMEIRGILTAYTIARAESHGMNSVFSKAGYSLAGTLRNNTQIGGKLESMNVWYRSLHSG
ncbi:putative beta-lysine N-acetyltransferase [Salidesulfovibrio brasiliensis]|uniref:putative beta-lysine N-acetyltransferase n=1 Tax=Salidesulfovibrio brasiliensis TaxID=221711 RepID=UPI0006D00A5F|nr:putative beta-lysine N-acetyltransferase [Salidesulfovibrio brasiliensis]